MIPENLSKEERALHISDEVDRLPEGSIKRIDGEAYEEYIARVVGDKGPKAWEEWNDSQRIEFLCENFAQQSLAFQQCMEQIELLIQANNMTARAVHELKNKNRFGVPNKKH